MTDTEAISPQTQPDPASPAASSHFARIGGAPAVEAAVGLFYDRVLADPELAGYFTDIDMVGLRRHMALMLTVVLGGPNQYRGRDLAQAHEKLDISVAHYAKVGQHLTETLTGLGVPQDILAHVGAVLGQVQDQVVGAGDRRGG